MIEVLDKTIWSFGENSCSYGGMIGRLTKCRWNGVVFFVRENLRGVNSFYIGSGERWGDKNGTGKPRVERQNLDLLAPDDHWQTIADIVASADGLKRPVLKTRSFTWAWAEAQFNQNVES